MKPHQFALILILFWVVFALTVVVARTVMADAPTLEDRLAMVQKPYQSHRDEHVDERALAHAIAVEANGDRRLAALLLTMAAHESALSEPIRRGECRPYECDAHRDRSGALIFKAWGLWQVHRNVFNSETWGSLELQDQAHAAARILRGALAQCRKSSTPFPVSVFRAARGYGCELPLKGEERRAATYAQIFRRL